MSRLNINAIALAVSLAFSAGAMAEGMSKADYKASKDNITTEYKSAKAACASLSGNANDVCVAEAKGKEKIAKADLEESYQPTLRTRYKARVARAEADYSVAKERCDDKAGTAKDICVEEAKAAKSTAEADAKAQMKISAANATASGKSAVARSEANEKTAEARKDAAASTLEAQYGVAKEKCDIYAGGAKDYCLEQAKKNFGKQ